jgi:hypothetical protein
MKYSLVSYWLLLIILMIFQGFLFWLLCHFTKSLSRQIRGHTVNAPVHAEMVHFHKPPWLTIQYWWVEAVVRQMGYIGFQIAWHGMSASSAGAVGSWCKNSDILPRTSRTLHKHASPRTKIRNSVLASGLLHTKTFRTFCDPGRLMRIKQSMPCSLPVFYFIEA